MLKKKKFLIGGLIVLIAIVYLGYIGFMDSATYYYTVSEFMEQGAVVNGETVRINGQVAPGSVEQGTGGRMLKFTIVDGEESLPVIYNGIVPDTFKAGGDVVIEGLLDSSGTFIANTLMPKCASKYVSQ
ncbi:cytochrome c maturation protein CcmE [Chloroflexota bacterium]